MIQSLLSSFSCKNISPLSRPSLTALACKMEREGWIRGSDATIKGGRDHRVGGQDPRGSWGLLVGLITISANKIKLLLKTNSST